MQGYEFLFGLLEALGKKWVGPLLIFIFLCEQATFSRIKRELRLTSRALSKKLKILEALGLVERIIIDNPKRIIYKLSEKGYQVSKTLLAFAQNQ